MRALLWALLLAPLLARAEFDHDHAAWTELLGRHVHWQADGKATRVDYPAFNSDKPALDAYLARLSAVSQAEFDAWSDDQQLAFLINAYNAYTVALIVAAEPGLESIKDLGSWLRTPWQRSWIPLLGAERSLDDIEHRLIRGTPDFREARIHFAVNCAAVGCPALRPEAYRADDLEVQMQDQTERFLADPSRNRFQAEQDTLYLSAIFRWYREDFELEGRSSSVATFAAGYGEQLGMDHEATSRLAAGGIRLRYLDYDWSLNGRR